MNGTAKKLVSFRLGKEMIDALNTAARITGQNKTEIIEACVRSHLPQLISAVKLDDHVKQAGKDARTQAAIDLKLMEEILSGKLAHPSVDETARKLALLESERIKKKRKKG